MELLSKVVVLSIEMMSWDRAMVRVPPSTGAPPEPLELDAPPPQAASATVATAAIPVNLNRVDRVIDASSLASRRRGTEGARADRWWLARAGGTAGRPDAATVAFITVSAKYFFVVTFGT